MSGKRKLDIEKLLQWAYRDELPKQFAGDGHSILADLAMLGAPIDAGEPRHGDCPLPVALGPPHPDALYLDYLVRGLPRVRVDFRKHRDHLMGPLAPYLDQHDPIVSAMSTGTQAKVVVMRGEKPVRATAEGKLRVVHASAKVSKKPLVKPQAESAAALVMVHARLGNRPIWDLGPVRLRRPKQSLVGRQIRKNVYTAGSMSLLQLDPPAQEIAAARFEYMVWHQALCALADLAGVMQDHVALPPSAPAAPWITGEQEEKQSRVLRAGPQTPLPRLPLKPSRPVTLPP